MKQPYAWLLCATALGAQAQTAPLLLPLLPMEKHGAHIPAVKSPHGSTKGTSYYTESFETGIDGWTVQNPVGDVPWAWTNTGPGPTASTYPVPPLSTNTGGWMMVDDDFLGTNGVNSETSLISPVIDLSAAPPNLQLEFDQYFQEFQLDHCFVGVSTDGGVTWTETEVNEGVGRDGRPNPELMSVNISDLVSPDPSTVQLRFRYAATWDYGWEIDNVMIKDLPNNDAALLNPRSTLFDFTNTGSDAQPYTIYPQAHLVPMDMNLQIRNNGFATQHNVVATVDVTGPGGDNFSDASSAVDLAPSAVNDVFFSTFTPNGSLGDYNVSFHVTQDENDAVPANNEGSGSFSVSSGTYALDHGSVDQFQRQAPVDLAEAFEVGNKFQMQADDQVIAVQVAIHNATPAGGLIYGAVYTPSTDALIHPTLEGDFTPEHVIDASELNAIGGSTFITMYFTNPVDVLQGNTYQVMAGSFEGGDSVRFATSGLVPAQIALIHYPNLSASFEFTFNKSPMVRAVMASGSIGIFEPDGTLSSVSASPNPFNSSCDLRFELAKSADVRVELHDAIGREVLNEQLGELGAGPRTYHINGDKLGDGLYLYSLIINGSRTSGKLTRKAN